MAGFRKVFSWHLLGLFSPPLHKWGEKTVLLSWNFFPVWTGCHQPRTNSVKGWVQLESQVCTGWLQVHRLESTMLKHCIIMEFFHAIAIIPMQVLLLCSYYAQFLIEKTPQTQRGTNIPPTGVHLSPLFILTAVTVCPDAGHCLTCLSELGQLFLPNLFATT